MIEVKSYNNEDSEKWDDFVENTARNSTFLHTRKFFRHNPINQELDSSLIFLKNSNILCVIPAVLQQINGRVIWNSHAYATYGGFVAADKLSVEDALEVIDLTIQQAGKHKADEIVVRNPFRVFYKVPTDETDYAMWTKGFQILRRDVEITLPLEGFTVQSVYSLYNGKTRNAVRKAEKENIKIRVSRDFSEYWQILRLNLASKHDAEPIHSLEQFQHLEKLVGEKHIKFFGAYLDDRLIAGIIVFVLNKQAVHAQYIAGLQEFLSLRPINLLIHQISVWAIENNFQYFNLGMCTDPGGSGLNLGLCKFKEGFGGRSILRETMHLILK